MIVSKLKLEFPKASWASRPGAAARRMFDQVVMRSENDPRESKAIERMSLGELLYFALLEQEVQA
jgi:hypothetical protein